MDPSKPYVDHQQNPLEPDREFCQDPPAEIGRVITAFSTMREGELRPFTKRTTLTLIATLTPLIASLLVFFLVSQEGGAILLLFSGLISLVAALELQRHECSYVGELGMARFRFSKPRFAIGKPAIGVFLFDSARVLYVKNTRQHFNGIYGGTSSEFSWRDGDGGRVFHLEGHYYSRKEKPRREKIVYLGRAAERAWTEWVLPKLSRELSEKGVTGFPIASGGGIFVSPESIKVEQGKSEWFFSKDEFKGLALQNGSLCIIHRDDKKKNLWLRYANVGNALAFFILSYQVLKPASEAPQAVGVQ